MIGVPSAPNATGAVLAMSDSPDAASGVKPRPIRIAPVTATGVPKPDAPSKNAPKEKATSSSCSRRSSVTCGDALAQHVEQPALVGQLVQEDHVEDDPADRQQPVGGAVAGGGERHRRRHVERADRDGERRGEAGERGVVGVHLRNASAPSSTTTGRAATSVDNASAPNGS